MKILVIGGGGREHALSLSFYNQGHEVYCFPGNAGTQEICQPFPKKWKHLGCDDFIQLIAFCKEMAIDMTVCGPEGPLDKGLADAFSGEGLLFLGPTKKASAIEGCKIKAKEFMRKYGIPTAKYSICSTPQEAFKVIDKHFYEWGGAVIKPSGLTGGKGVYVCQSPKEAQDAITRIMVEKRYGNAGREVVIEELLRGREVSLMAFCDGKTMVPMVPAQDHKRLYDAGQGPNTGGVGAYSPTPFLDQETFKLIERNFLEKTCEGLVNEAIDYRGFLYLGLMLTDQGPKLLEYNCRLGDPEAQVILPLLESDLASILLCCCEGRLREARIEWSRKAACCVVMISRGYPKSYKTGFPIQGLESLKKEEKVIVTHAGTKRDESGHVVTDGGRVLGITAVAETLDEAISNAYRSVEKIHFEGAYYRSDIGNAIGTSMIS